MAKTKEKSDTKVLVIPMKDSSEEGKGTTIKFAWRGNKDAYPDDVAKELGVSEAKDGETGLIFGMNNPRPVRIYINVKLDSATGKSKSKNKSYRVFAAPHTINSLLLKNPLKGKKYRSGTITGIGIPKSGTNPTRKKKTSNKKGQDKK